MKTEKRRRTEKDKPNKSVINEAVLRDVTRYLNIVFVVVVLLEAAKILDISSVLRLDLFAAVVLTLNVITLFSSRSKKASK
ncbi:Uncharacterised protein [uncultured archaeon]|nr:Uncharacterised protein [uncultured archaeon]